MSEMPWPPRPMELGKQTCAWIARVVHDVDTGGDVEGAQVDLVLGPLEERLGGAALAAVAVDDPTPAGEAELGAVDVPHRLAVDLDHVGHPVLVLGRRPLGPQVVGLGQVGVGVDHPQPVKCQRHRPSPGSVLDVHSRRRCRIYLRPKLLRPCPAGDRPRRCRQRVRGNPRSISLVAGSGQRVVTTLGRV